MISFIVVLKEISSGKIFFDILESKTTPTIKDISDHFQLLGSIRLDDEKRLDYISSFVNQDTTKIICSFLDSAVVFFLQAESQRQFLTWNLSLTGLGNPAELVPNDSASGIALQNLVRDNLSMRSSVDFLLHRIKQVLSSSATVS